MRVRPGRITSGATSHRFKKCLSMAYVQAGDAAPGTALEVAVLERRVPAVVVGVQVLHGLSFGIFWPCAVALASQAVPADQPAATQEASLVQMVNPFEAGSAPAGSGRYDAGHDAFGALFELVWGGPEPL